MNEVTRNLEKLVDITIDEETMTENDKVYLPNIFIQ